MSPKKPTAFQNLVYNATRRIPKGRVSTYSEVARAINNPKAVRAVGQALNKNPFAPQVPCHRVVSKSGRLGGFALGDRRKIQILKKEGVEVRDGKIVDFKKKLFSLQ